MAQTQIFRGVQSSVIRESMHITGLYRGTAVAKAERIDGNKARITLYTGGWQSNTTKTRMNQFAHQFCNSQYGVYQKAGEWFVSINGVVNPVKFIGHTVVFLIDARHVQFKGN